jgi:hypothetical protein
MKIEPRQIPVHELVAAYADNGDAGVVGYSGRLNIRPPYPATNASLSTKTDRGTR